MGAVGEHAELVDERVVPGAAHDEQFAGLGSGGGRAGLAQSSRPSRGFGRCRSARALDLLEAAREISAGRYHLVHDEAVRLLAAG